MRVHVVNARYASLIEGSIAREIRDIEAGIVPDSFFTESELNDTGTCVCVVFTPNGDSLHDVVRTVMQGWQQGKDGRGTGGTGVRGSSAPAAGETAAARTAPAPTSDRRRASA